MKRLLLIFTIFFTSINLSNACKIAELGKTIPQYFKENCYSLIGELNPEINGFDIGNGEKCIGWNTFKVKANEKIDTFISNDKIIPYKLFKKAGEEINYKIKNLDGNINYLKDNNYKTYLIYDEELTNRPIEISFNNILKAGTYKFNFDYKANYRNAQIEISKDGIKYYPINKYKISDYDLKFIKIYFRTNVKHITPPEKIKIYELNFLSTNYIYLIKTRGSVKAYSKNICKSYYPDLTNNPGNFDLNKNTKELELVLKDNILINPNKINDSDNDGIEDNIDNCPNIYNPMQKDSNGDGIGDLCADDDGDSIIGNKDNCINIYNPDQKDVNRNGVGDKCEFDKDKDGIFDELDNCITTYNPDQNDDDKDGIGNACDNCKLYNPSQLDKNGNGIGDVCEEHDKYILEHDKDKDKIIDFKDNCPTKYNPNQEDSDGDSIGDVCDNCKNIQNPDQLDKNKNGIGDICEDSDGDSVDGLHDNCINIYNPDQKDSDNDGIGDACEDEDSDNIPAKKDNCPYDYNPDQADIDKDGIGNVCDKKDDRFIESNKNIFIVLLVLVVLIFGFAIFKMIKKLK